MTETKKNPEPLFVIDPAPVIKWPVIVNLPADGGESAAFRFTGIFKRLSEAELDTLLGVEGAAKIKPAESDELIAGELVSKRMQDVLRENANLFPQILLGWEDVKLADGTDAAFSGELLRAQVTGPNGRFLSAGLWRAVAEIRHGARLGN